MLSEPGAAPTDILHIVKNRKNHRNHLQICVKCARIDSGLAEAFSESGKRICTAGWDRGSYETETV